MTTLPVRTKTVHFVDYRELDAFINAQLKPKQRYECIAGEEWGNDSEHAFTVKDTHQTVVDGQLVTKPGIDEYEQADINAWLAGERSGQWLLHSILNHLCCLGLIKAGDYIIEVCW